MQSSYSSPSPQAQRLLHLNKVLGGALVVHSDAEMSEARDLEARGVLHPSYIAIMTAAEFEQAMAERDWLYAVACRRDLKRQRRLAPRAAMRTRPMVRTARRVNRRNTRRIVARAGGRGGGDPGDPDPAPGSDLIRDARDEMVNGSKMDAVIEEKHRARLHAAVAGVQR